MATLLEKALASKPNARNNHANINKEDIELAVEFHRGNVRPIQAMAAMGIRNSAVLANRMQTVLKYAIHIGVVELKYKIE